MRMEEVHELFPAPCTPKSRNKKHHVFENCKWLDVGRRHTISRLLKTNLRQ